jgi:hypothetical protein
VDLTNLDEWKLQERFQEIGHRIRTGAAEVGRHHYALSLAHGVRQALHCGYPRVSAVEIGVAGGGGLLDLCKAASFLEAETGVEIAVFGIDNATGLPPLTDHRDHPEIWRAGQFAMGDPDALRARLPPNGRLLIGDAGPMVERFLAEAEGAPLGFVAIDVDYYSSTVRALPILLGPAARYVPAVPVYFDDVDVLLTYNEWCGEAAALREFNYASALRKIDRKPQFGIHNFHVCHVLDHPVRTGAVAPRLPFEIRPI